MSQVAREYPERAFRTSRGVYRSMAEHGLFQGHRVELIRGEIVEMSPQNHPHSRAIQRLTSLLQRALPEGIDVRVQLPLIGPEDSEPEPDLAVVVDDPHGDDHPTTALLVIEVSDSSVSYDRRVKSRLYAEMGIAEMWLVNLHLRRIEVHDRPVAGEFTRVTPYGPGEQVPVGAFPEIRVPVDSVLSV